MPTPFSINRTVFRIERRIIHAQKVFRQKSNHARGENDKNGIFRKYQ